MKKLFISLATISAIILSSCCSNKEKEETTKTEMQQLVESYAPVKLTTDLSILSEKEREVIKYFVQGYSYTDIADILGVSYKSVDNTLTRIKNKLKPFKENL